MQNHDETQLGSRGPQLSHGKRSILSSQMEPYYNSDNGNNSDENSNHQNMGCLQGGCIGGWLGHDGGGGGGAAAAAVAGGGGSAGNNDDDPTFLVAQELNKLSLKERGIVYEDLHGVSMFEDESDPKFVIKHLKDMNTELDTIPRSKKVAYIMAMEEFGETGKEFCQDRSLYLMFLRADRWDSKKAATRFVGWLDWKLLLFGRDVLCHRHVTLDQLDKDTLKTIQAGRLQILPQRDSSGRTVIFDSMGRHSQFNGTVKSNLKQFWYMMMATVEDDIQSQQLGIVCIMYSVDGNLSWSADDRRMFWDIGNMLPMLPVRINSTHFCFNNPKLMPLLKLIQMPLPSHIRARNRSHQGNHTEVQYSLMTYGFPIDSLPVAMTDDKIKTIHHLKWYKRRKARDATLANCVGGGRDKDFYGIDLPGRCDVLLGKGKSVQRHMGNRRLKELVSMYFQEYDTALHGDKILVAEKLISSIPDLLSAKAATLPIMAGQSHDVSDSNVARTGSAPRFLKRRDDGWWAPVPHEEAIAKVCHSFREYRSSNARKTSAKTRTPAAFRGTDEITNMVSSSTSTVSGKTTATKRVKVELQGVVEPQVPTLKVSEPSLFMGGEEEGDEGKNNPINSTTKEDEILDLDGFDWDI